MLCECESADEQGKIRIALSKVAEALEKELFEGQEATISFFVVASSNGMSNNVKMV